MLDWLSQNQALVIAVIALFGAGGAGTLIVKQLLRGGGSPGGPAVHTQAQDGSTAVSHTGTGDIDVRVNEAVSRGAFEAWRTELGLSRAATARLLRTIEAIGLGPERVDALTAELRTGGGDDWDALADALEHEDLATARTELRALDARSRRLGRGA